MKAKFDRGELIQEARKKAGLSQRKLAEKTRISESEICAYENNRRRPGIEKYARIAKALNISIDELYFGDTNVTFARNDLSEGEIIARCIRILWEKEVVSLIPATAIEGLGGIYQININDGILLNKYAEEISSLLQKLETYADDKENLPDPESFIAQIIQAGAKMIDKQVELDSEDER